MDNAKKLITSLLTSTPLAVTVQQLSKDYKNTIGESIPHQKFGFNSLEHFLRSIPDTVRVRGNGQFAEVLPVLSSKSSHVMDMVAKQKKNAPKKRDRYYGKRTVIFTPQKEYLKQNSHPPAEQKTRIQYPSYPFHQSNSKPTENIKPAYYSTNENYREQREPEKKIEIDHGRDAWSTLEKYEKTNHDIHNSDRYSQVHVDDQVSKSEKLVTYPEVVNDVQKSNNTFEHSKPPDTPKSSVRSHHKKKLHHSHHSDRAKLPFSENLENAIPQTIQNNLRMLIGRYPTGIWCADVPIVYRQMFNRELKYEEFGFRSLIHLCTSLKSIFHYVRPSSEDFKLYDRSKPLPSSAEKVYTIASYGDVGKTDKEGGSALPNIDWEDVMRYLPPCTFKPGKEIPRAFVSELTLENDSIDIKVGEIYDLSKFWIYFDDGLLDTLMDNMQVFYNNHAKDYIIPQQLVREGLYCVQLFFGEYHRALVVDLISPPEDMVRVVFIDYGTVAKVPIKDLCFLHEDFANFPAQAIRCRLANICPPEKGAPWNRESTKTFRQLLMDKDLTAKVIRINWKDQFLEVCLADVTDGNNVFYIHDILVERGFAIYPNQEQKRSIIDSISTPVVNLIHLFPTFMEIERGLAPSTSEMEVFHDLNVPINFCYPQYFKFESGEEEKIIKLAASFHEKYCVKETRINSIHSKYFMDKEKLNPEPIDMSYFGQLENDVLACCEYETPENEEFSKDLDDKTDYLEGDIAIISKRLEFLKTKTVDELRKDCSLSEDIMRDILSICDEDNSAHCKINNEISDRELYMIEEEANIDTNTESVKSNRSNEEDFYSPIRSPTDENIQECDESHPLCKMTFDRVISSPSYDFPVSVVSELDCNEISAESENSKSAPRTNNDMKTLSYSSTNPFLQDLNGTANEESNSSDNILRLNPNNPFLSYLKPKTGDNCSNGVDKTTASTVHDYVEKVNIHKKWSTNDDRSSDTSVSNCSFSSDSIKTSNDVEKCSMLTNTPEDDITLGYAPQNYSVNPSAYRMPMPNFAGHQNWTMGFNNPYYNTRFPNCNYYPPEPRFCPPYLSPMHRMGFGLQNMLPQSTVCPPPGFAPRTNFSHGNSNYNITMNGIDPRIPNRQTELFRPPFQMYNCVSETATISNVSVTGERDFYEMYNAQLRLRIQQATTNE